jgi:Beta/Gamma crystallin
MKIQKIGLVLALGASLAACGTTTPAPSAVQEAGTLSTLATSNAVCFYENTNYQGKSYCVQLPAAGSTTSVAYVGDELNDKFSSLKIQSGRNLTVTASWDSNFGGGYKQFYSSVPDLEATPGFSWGAGVVRINDAISSFTVGR